MDGITFRLRGSDRSNDLVRAGDFIVFLQRLLATLGEIDRTLNGNSTRFYQITNLEIGSAGATLQEVVEEKSLGRRHLYRDVEPAFQELIKSVLVGSRPAWAAPEVVIKLRELAEPLRHVSTAQLISPENVVKLDDNYRRKIEQVIGRDITSLGDVVGTLDAVNVHQHFRAYLYQAPGEKPISCEFNASMRSQVIENIGHRVKIYGHLRRREDSERPFGVKIRSIERLPEDADLPLFASLIGVAQGFPDIDPVEYIRNLRDADA
jgi:hypothetical protein